MLSTLEYAYLVSATLIFMLTTTPARAQSAGCFGELHNERSRPVDREFDVRFDRPAGGGSFSCDLGILASDARAALDAFRSGVLYGSEADLQAAIRFPITVSVRTSLSVEEKPRSLRISNVQEWLLFQQRYLDSAHRALVACSTVLNVAVVKQRSYGFMIGSGDIWFQRTPADRRPRVTVVNLSPESDDALLRHCKEGPEQGFK